MRLRGLFICTAVSVCSALVSTGTIAQDAERLVEQALPQVSPENAPLTGDRRIVNIQDTRILAPIGAGNPELAVRSVTLDCINCIDEAIPAEVDAVVRETIIAPLIGTTITLSDAYDLLPHIERVYDDMGFLFVNAVIVPQELDPAAADLLIKVVQSRLGTIEIVPATGSSERVLSAADRIADLYRGSDEPITLDGLERLVLLVNDLPGVTRATATPSRGGDAGVVDLTITVDADTVGGVFFADNRQSPVLGPGIAGVSVEGNSLLLPGDAAILSLFNSFGNDRDDFTERHTVQLEYDALISARGTRAGIRGLYSESAPGDILAPLDLDTSQRQVELSLQDPLIRTRRLSAWGFTSILIDEGVTDTANGQARLSEDSLRVLSAGLRARVRGSDIGYVFGEVEVRQGLDIFDASQTGDTAVSRFDGSPDFTLVRGEIEGEVFLPFGDDFLRDRLSFYGRAMGQYSSDALFAGEEFTIGGPDYGRAFDPSELSGDNGYAIAAEIRHRSTLPDIPINDFFSDDRPSLPASVQFYGYADYGKVFNLEDGFPEEDSLSSYGAGARFTIGDSQLNLEFSKPNQALSRNQKSDTRIFFSFAHRF